MLDEESRGLGPDSRGLRRLGSSPDGAGIGGTLGLPGIVTGSSRAQPVGLLPGAKLLLGPSPVHAAPMPHALQPRRIVLDRFDFDRDALKPEHHRALKRLASSLISALQRYPGRLKVRIESEGHTDPVGSHDYNVGLGIRRALNVTNALDALLRRHFKMLLTIVFSSEGEKKPVASNATPSGREQNRRVEIRVEIELLEAPPPDPPKPRKVTPDEPPTPIDREGLRACNQLARMTWFKPFHGKLMAAALQAFLSVDTHGTLEIQRVPKKTYTSLFSKKLQAKVEEHLTDMAPEAAGKLVLGEVLIERLLGALQAAQILRDLRNRQENMRLVLERGPRGRRRRHRKKLSLLMDILARDPGLRHPIKGTRFPTPADAKLWLWKNYWKYQKLLELCDRYEGGKQSDPRTPPSIGPR